MFFNRLTENIAVDIYFGFWLKNIRDGVELNPSLEGFHLSIFNHLLIFRVHKGEEERIDILLNVADFVNTFTQNVMQFKQTIFIMQFNIHENINAVIRFCKRRITVSYGILPEKPVKTFL